MKKNGFVFVETIVAIVVLTSSLLLLYSSFNKILQSEKTRVYHDDVAYLYRSYYIKEQINNLNFASVINDLLNNDKYFVTIGLEYQNLFDGYDSERTFLQNMLQDFEVRQMVVIKENKIDDLKKCYESDYSNVNCNDLYTNLNDEFINYLKTIYVDVSCTYILAVEYNTCTSSNGNENCKKYYSWVSV